MLSARFYLSLLLYLPIAIASTVFTIASVVFFNWVVVLFCDGKGNLPSWLRWFGTFDASCDEGMLARQRYLRDGSPEGYENWNKFNPDPQTWRDRYMNRVRWLNRNPGYGIDYYLFGFTWRDAEWTVVKYASDEAHTVFIAVGPAFNFYYEGPLGTWKFGWKAWNNWDPTNKTWKPTEDPTKFRRAVFTISGNPFKKKD